MNRGRLFAWTAFVAAFAALAYAVNLTGSVSSNHNVVYKYSTFAGGTVEYAIWLGIVLAIGAGHRDLFALRRPVSIGGAAGLAIVVLVGVFIVEVLVDLLPIENPGKEQGLTPTHWEPAHAGAFAANLVLFAAIAPVVEELTFRGLGQSLLAFLGQWPSIVLVGIAFGLAHGLVEALLVLVPFGMALAWLRARTDSVFPGMVVHGLFNALALVAAVLG
ncbi:MAG TPA: CPBP family intramembrane glutamic endopeptidase [Gaiellaceae bacterium]|nr:CPBP family intramembrane glutamic endopeptidase [Gaiellaceae bacterium]